jgi:hypothetical protein
LHLRTGASIPSVKLHAHRYFLKLCSSSPSTVRKSLPTSADWTPSEEAAFEAALAGTKEGSDARWKEVSVLMSGTKSEEEVRDRFGKFYGEVVMGEIGW